MSGQAFYEFDRVDSPFLSGKLRCDAWLYLPRDVPRPPIVVMAHGLGAEKTFALPAYAKLFAARGLAVLLFDYRHFGPSEGEPRQLVSHYKQQADWQAAVAHAQSLPEVDGTRIGLWGTSYAGGHVIHAAAKLPQVKAIVAQVPMVNVLRSLRSFPLSFIVSATLRGLRDAARKWTGRAPYEVPIASPPDQFGVLNLPGCDKGFRAILPTETATWRNATPARVFVSSLTFRPGRFAAQVKCPALLIVAERDQLIPCETIYDVAKQMPRAEIIKLPLDHFQPYLPEHFAKLAPQQAEFLVRHL